VSPEPAGAAELGNSEQGHCRGLTVTATPAPGVSMLPLSSAARLMILKLPVGPGVQLYDHDDVPVAGCQVAPLSVETSTPATTPPPASDAVPVTCTAVPLVCVDPPLGELTVDVGGVWSVDAVAATRPGWIVVGCTPMSASRLTVACCIAGSVGVESPS
jgi:hypothetical protein